MLTITTLVRRPSTTLRSHVALCCFIGPPSSEKFSSACGLAPIALFPAYVFAAFGARSDWWTWIPSIPPGTPYSNSKPHKVQHTGLPADPRSARIPACPNSIRPHRTFAAPSPPPHDPFSSMLVDATCAMFRRRKTKLTRPEAFSCSGCSARIERLRVGVWFRTAAGPGTGHLGPS